MRLTSRLLSSLPKPSPNSIPSLHQPSLSTFRSLLTSSQPALLTGLISHWPALTSWTPANNLGQLRTLAQGVLVPVEWAPRGRGYPDPDAGKTTMLLETYLDAFILDKIPWEDPTIDPGLTFYMAQCDLLEKVRPACSYPPRPRSTSG